MVVTNDIPSLISYLYYFGPHSYCLISLVFVRRGVWGKRMGGGVFRFLKASGGRLQENYKFKSVGGGSYE